MANDNLTTVYRNYKYRLNLKKGQYKELSAILESQRQLYNAALEERIGCYKKTGKTLTYIDQYKSLTVLRKDSCYSNVPANMQRWTLKKLDAAYKGFFNRGGFPRFKSFNRWKSIGFVEFKGVTLNNDRIKFKGLMGSLKVYMHRPLQGSIKSCVLKRDQKGWYVFFQCAVTINKIKKSIKNIGVDVGLNDFATLSSGDKIPNPRIARRSYKKIRIKQRALARCKKGSNRRLKVRNQLIAAHNKIKNTRQTFLHQQSAALARKYSLIAVEDLKIRNMVKCRNFSRSIHDAGWNKFITMLEYKVEETGGQVIRVNPRNTSQACSGCGQIVPKELSVRVHSCDCGLVLDRDENAARNILALAVVGQNEPNVGGCTERARRNAI